MYQPGKQTTTKKSPGYEEDIRFIRFKKENHRRIGMKWNSELVKLEAFSHATRWSKKTKEYAKKPNLSIRISQLIRQFS